MTTFKKGDKMYICPNATNCNVHCGYAHRFPHKHDSRCDIDTDKYGCPKCVPVELVEPEKEQVGSINLCPHCGMDTAITNPSGYCNHVYYPDNDCAVCNEMRSGKTDKSTRIRELINVFVINKVNNKIDNYSKALDELVEKIVREG